MYVCLLVPPPKFQFQSKTPTLSVSLFLSFVCLRVCNTLALECCKGNTQSEIPYYTRIYCIYNLSSELAGALYINIKAQLTFIHTFFFDFLGDAKVKAPSSECDTLVSPFPPPHCYSSIQKEGKNQINSRRRCNFLAAKNLNEPKLMKRESTDSTAILYSVGVGLGKVISRVAC